MDAVKICIHCGKKCDTDGQYCEDLIIEMEIREKTRNVEM